MTAAEIATHLAGRAGDVCAHLFPAGRRNGDEYEIGDVTGAPGRSLRINLNGRAGVWSDFATGDKGDLLDLWREARRLTVAAAMREAAEWLGESSRRPARQDEDGVPVEAPAGHPKWKGKPNGRWCYTTADGTPWLIVYRYDLADATKAYFVFDLQAGKWCKGTEHRLPDRRPLYRLGSVTQRPAGEIVLAEGEKCADALARLGLDATSTLGGSGQIRHADFSPLKGWRVRIWPDADVAGRQYAETAATMLRGAGAEPLLVPVPADVPDGWDVADAVRDGWRLEEIKAQLNMAEPCESNTSSASGGFDVAAHLRSLSEVSVVPHRYLWEPYLPLGKFLKTPEAAELIALFYDRDARCTAREYAVRKHEIAKRRAAGFERWDQMVDLLAKGVCRRDGVDYVTALHKVAVEAPAVWDCYQAEQRGA